MKEHGQSSETRPPDEKGDCAAEQWPQRRHDIESSQVLDVGSGTVQEKNLRLLVGDGKGVLQATVAIRSHRVSVAPIRCVGDKFPRGGCKEIIRNN